MTGGFAYAIPCIFIFGLFFYSFLCLLVCSFFCLFARLLVWEIFYLAMPFHCLTIRTRERKRRASSIFATDADKAYKGGKSPQEGGGDGKKEVPSGGSHQATGTSKGQHQTMEGGKALERKERPRLNDVSEKNKTEVERDKRRCRESSEIELPTILIPPDSIDVGMGMQSNLSNSTQQQQRDGDRETPRDDASSPGQSQGDREGSGEKEEKEGGLQPASGVDDEMEGIGAGNGTPADTQVGRYEATSSSFSVVFFFQRMTGLILVIVEFSYFPLPFLFVLLLSSPHSHVVSLTLESVLVEHSLRFKELVNTDPPDDLFYGLTIIGTGYA
jgi:hypothetical protein